jgi:hypothetical protein
MYAFIVENDQGTWDIWNTLSYIKSSEKKERVDSALSSDFPITGQDVSEHRASARSGAIWDGVEWTGGETTLALGETALNLFAYVCNDTIILMHISEPNTDSDAQIRAVFESENSMIKVPEGQTASVGDIWDGEKVIHRV